MHLSQSRRTKFKDFCWSGPQPRWWIFRSTYVHSGYIYRYAQKSSEYDTAYIHESPNSSSHKILQGTPIFLITNLLNITKSQKCLNKLINIDLKILQNGLMPIKYIYTNFSKRKMVLFRRKRKSIDFNLKIQLNRKQ